MTAPHLNTAPQLTGSTLTLRALFTPTSGCPPIADTALTRVEVARQQLLTARDTGDVYGANTGVGANRAVQVGNTAGTSHGLRLLRSHCAGFGPTEDDDIVRAAMLIRLNQMLAGGAGVSPGFVTGLADALTADALPTLHRYGSIGTADLSPLAELALTLIGERPWKTGTLGPVPLGDSDALPFISSSAITIATAARAVRHTQQLLQAAETVTALSFLALGGARQAWNPRVHAARAHPHQLEVAQRLTQLVHTEADPPPARLQDPYGLRIVPQVHAPALSALDTLAATVEREMNSATENPLVVDNGVLHHGQFHLATLAAHLDHARTTLLPTLALCASRLSLLMMPTLTGLSPFLSDGTPGSSGLMITEYVVQDALAQARALAAPASGPSVSISLGLEEHASFASQAAGHLHAMHHQAQVIFAVEALAAVRALRMAPDRLLDCPAGKSFKTLSGHLSADMTDRSLGDDISAAMSILPTFAQPSI